jgi:hypothetical protein
VAATRRLREARLGTAALVLVVVASLALVALFWLTPITDDLRKRFTVFATLTIGTLGIVDLRGVLPRRWYLAMLLVLLLQPSLRLAKHVAVGRGPSQPDYSREALARFVPANALVSVEHVGRSPRPLAGYVLVSPP